jgi:phytoene dehydrogenase-like protein
VETLMARGSSRVVVIGAGHNGLIAACYLAKSGHPTTVLERRDKIGGIAAVEEFHPGFRYPGLIQAPVMLLPQVIKDLQLEKHGLETTRAQSRMVAIDRDGRALSIYDDPQLTASELAGWSKLDAQRYPDFYSCLSRIGAAIAPLLSAPPPNIEDLRIDDYLHLGRLGLNVRRLDRKDAFRLMRWAPMAVADLAAEWFEDELLRAIVAAGGVFGSFAGPWSAGTSVGLLLRAALGHSALHVKNGGAALLQSLSRAAAAGGVEIRTNAAVKRVGVKNGEVDSVLLESGEEIAAKAVVSNADPRHTLLDLLDATDLDPGFLSKARAYRSTGCVAKVHLALSSVPVLSAIKDGSPVPEYIHVGPNIDYLERAFDDAKYGQFSKSPYLRIHIPSMTDPALAPQGSHVMSVHVQYAPYRLRDDGWDQRRDELGEAVVQTLSAHIPKLRDLIVHRHVLTPLDLERTYGLSGGHLFHGEHALDQLFAFRPLLGWARYRTPVKGLYLCGSGTHPGGGITGVPGANAGREILKDLKVRK